MSLLLTYMACVLVGQVISVTFGLVIEHFTTSHTSLLAFIPLYFATFWIAWKVAVRLTEPKAPALADQSSARVSSPATHRTPARREATRLQSRDAPA